jgi:hypothetical protein
LEPGKLQQQVKGCETDEGGERFAFQDLDVFVSRY